MKPRALGRHWLIDYYGCSDEIIKDQHLVRDAMIEAARRSQATIVTDVFHSFNPHGVSGVVVIAESHLAIHTWPEHRCASVDIFSCSEKMFPQIIEQFLKNAFDAEEIVRTEFERGRILR